MYFTAYTFWKDTFGKEWYLHFQSYQLNLTNIKRIQNIINIPTIMVNRINCFQSEKGHESFYEALNKPY